MEGDFTYGFFTAINLLAGLQGFILAGILLFKKRFASTSNRFYALALLGISVIVLYDVLYYALEADDPWSYVLYLPVYIRSSIPIGLYFFVRFLIEPKRAMNSWERFWWVPIALEFAIEICFIVSEFLVSGEVLVRAEKLWRIAGETIGLLTALFLLGLAIVKLNRYQKFLLENYSSLTGKSLKWLRNLIAASLIIVIVWVYGHLQFILGYEDELIYELVALGLILFLFWMGYFVILQYPLFQVVPYSNKSLPKESSKKLSPKTEQYHGQLLQLMKEQQLFADPELNLASLAEKLQISAGYLSQIINEKEEKNFFEFVNGYRVNAAKEKLTDNTYDQYSILGIALESGFSSKSTFNSLFKKYTGQTPSAYKKAFQ